MLNTCCRHLLQEELSKGCHKAFHDWAHTRVVKYEDNGKHAWACTSVWFDCMPDHQCEVFSFRCCEQSARHELGLARPT